MREYVCGKLSPSKCRILHNKAAEALEKQYASSEISSLKSILFHYKMAENHEKYLCYEIANLEKYSGLNYELYPVLESAGGETSSPGDDIFGYFAQIEKDLLEYHHNNPSFTRFDELFSKLMHAKSRYCILTGNYETGIRCLEAGMKNPYTKSNGNFMLMFMRQMVYYAIQVYDMDILDKYTKDGLMMSLSLANSVEHAFYHRLRGLYFINIGDYRQAFASLIKSIDYFSKAELHNQPYILNIAASYNYLGELNRRNGHYPEAIQYYNKAISLCSENNCVVNPTFYSNLASAYFASGNREEAQKFFSTADSAYNNTVTLMGKAVTKIYMAYFRYLDNNSDYLDYISQAEDAADTLGSPTEKGILLYVKSKIAAIKPDDFTESSSHYLAESNSLLCNIPGETAKF